MSRLIQAMQAILSYYDGDLYNSALTKMVYLVDLTSVKETGEQITGIKWERDHHGAFVWDILDCAKERLDLFSIVLESSNKRRIILRESVKDYSIPDDILLLVEVIVRNIPNPKHNFLEFKRYVYETSPMLTSIERGPLDLKAALEATHAIEETDKIMAGPEWDEALEYLAAN